MPILYQQSMAVLCFLGISAIVTFWEMILFYVCVTFSKCFLRLSFLICKVRVRKKITYSVSFKLQNQEL